MSRRSIENLNINPNLLDTSLWPTVLTENLSPDYLTLFLKRKKAIDLYISTDMKVKDIETETGLRRDEIHRFVLRCLEKDELGEVMGYRALIPYKRIKDYNRNNFPDYNEKVSKNYTGAFELLLDTYPTLKELIIDSYLNRKNNKYEIIDPVINIRNLHKKFINECRVLGLKMNEYPFNTKTLAKKSLERYVKALSKNHFVEVSKRSGEQAAMVAKNTGIGNKNNPMFVRPLERVEVDGHRIDTSIAIVFKTPEVARGMTILQLPEEKRNEMSFFSLQVTRRVNGSEREGRRPYIFYEGVRYTNEVLNHSSHLINKTLNLLINTDDLRVIKAFLADGSELGNLIATGKWGITPHDLRTRKVIKQIKK